MKHANASLAAMLAWILVLPGCTSEPLGVEDVARLEAAVINGAVAAESGPDSFAAVVRDGNNCTMTRIGPRHFLTAAHCLMNAVDVDIQVGSSLPVSLGTFSHHGGLSRMADHDFDPDNSHQYDLAVVTIAPTKRPAYDDLRRLQSIPTLAYEDAPPGDEWVTLVGYGHSMEGGLPVGGGRKRFGLVHTGHEHPGFDCSSRIDPTFNFELGHTELVQDASGRHYTSTDGAKSAPGDSGGPILKNGKIVGVVHGSYPGLHVAQPVGTKVCGVASRLNQTFIDETVKAPIIDGIGDTAAIDPSQQMVLGDVELRIGQPAQLYISGHHLDGATFTWEDGRPVDIVSSSTTRDVTLGLDHVVLTLKTVDQSTIPFQLVAHHPDSFMPTSSDRRVHFVCAPDEEWCDYRCVKTQSDPEHCGYCHNACNANEPCLAGVCVRDDDQDGDGDGNGDGDGDGDGNGDGNGNGNGDGNGNGSGGGDGDGNGDGGAPIGGAGSVGDPHLESWDHRFFDLQTSGELILAADDRGAVVQVRQEPYPGSRYAAYNTAVAAKVGGHRVGVYTRPALHVRIDGVEVELHDNAAVKLTGGGRVAAIEAGFAIYWPNGDRLVVFVEASHLDLQLSFDLGDGRRFTGLLGNANGTPDDDFMTRSGVLLESAGAEELSFADQLALAASWRVHPVESLFDYLPGESTASFDIPGFPLDAAAVLDPSSPEWQHAAGVCSAAGIGNPRMLEACTTDIALTGDESFATGIARIFGGADGGAAHLMCAVATAEPAACHACCHERNVAGAAKFAAKPSATVVTCMCRTLFPGYCEEACGTVCEPGDTSTPSATCSACLQQWSYADLCQNDPGGITCQVDTECYGFTLCDAMCDSM